jgi:hypothetical protein
MGADQKSSSPPPPPPPLKWIAKPLCPTEPPPAPVWLIRNVLPKGFLTVLKGLPGALKTYVLISWLMCLDTEIAWCGRKVMRTRSLLITPDDPRGAIIRARAFAEHHGVRLQDVQSRIFEEPVNLTKIADVMQAAENIKRQGLTPGILASDTLFHNSVGANLKEADEVLEILQNFRWLAKEIGAHTAITTHHPPKTGEGAYGSISLVADVGVIYDCEKLAPDRTRLTCERMKHDRIPDPMEVTTVTVKTETRCEEDDGEHQIGEVVMVDEMVVTSEADAMQQPTEEDKADKDDKLMKDILLGLGNSVTYGQWRNTAQSVTAKDGKKGWSDATFDRRLAEFKKRHPELTGGRWQGDPYSLGIQPAAARAERVGELAEAPSTLASNHPQHSPLKGVSVVEGGFAEASSTLNHPQKVVEGRSSQGSAEGKGPTSPADELARLKQQLG